jgi:hypothetical protein
MRFLLVLYSLVSVVGGMCIAWRLYALLLVLGIVALFIGHRIEKALSNLETLGRGYSSPPPSTGE